MVLAFSCALKYGFNARETIKHSFSIKHGFLINQSTFGVDYEQSLARSLHLARNPFFIILAGILREKA